MPDQGKGYFNFEINCCGTMLLYYIEDPKRTEDGFEKYELVKQELVKRMTIFHSISGKVEVEIETPVEWYIEYNIPFSLFEAYLVRRCDHYAHDDVHVSLLEAWGMGNAPEYSAAAGPGGLSWVFLGQG